MLNIFVFLLFVLIVSSIVLINITVVESIQLKKEKENEKMEKYLNGRNDEKLYKDCIFEKDFIVKKEYVDNKIKVDNAHIYGFPKNKMNICVGSYICTFDKDVDMSYANLIFKLQDKIKNFKKQLETVNELIINLKFGKNDIEPELLDEQLQAYLTMRNRLSRELIDLNSELSQLEKQILKEDGINNANK